MNSEIQQEVRSSGISRAWVGIKLAAKEVEEAQSEIGELESQVSTLDRLNVFTDSPEEARIKDCKDRIKSRTQDYKDFAQQTGDFITKLGEKFPDFQVATSLEGLLSRALRATEPGHFKKLGKDMDDWLGAFSEHLGEITETPRASLILEQLFVGPYQHTRRALCELSAAFDLVKVRSEDRWDKTVSVLSLRAMFLELIRLTREAFGKDCEGIPLPYEIYQSLAYEKESEEKDPMGSLLRRNSEAALTECLQTCLDINRNLAGYKALILVNLSEISTLDRVVFWSDTKAEAREKEWKAQLKEQQSALKERWAQLCSKNQEIREKIWATFLLDRGHRVQTLVGRIFASDPKGFMTKTAEVMGREPATLVVEKFRRDVFDRYPFLCEISDLQERATNSVVDYPPVECDALGNPPNLRPPELVAQLGSKFLKTGFLDEKKRADDLAQRQEEERQRKAREYEKKSTLGKIGSVFSNLASGIAEAFQVEEDPTEALELRFLGLLEDVHTPTLLNILLHRLGQQLASIQATVNSRTVRVDENRTETEYYSVLVGHQSAFKTASQLAKVVEKTSADCPFPLEWLERFCLSPVVEGIEAHPVRF